MNRTLKKYNKGMTLVETLLVVGAIMLISMTVFTTYSKKSQDNKVKIQSDYFVLLQDNVQRLAASSVTFATVTPANLIAADAVPREMVNGANIRNLYSGNVTFAPTTLVAAGDAVGMTITNIPQDACSKLSIGVLGQKSNKITVNGVVVRANNAAWDSTVVANIGNNCTSAGNNTLIFEKLIERLSLATGPTTDPITNSGLFVLAPARSKEVAQNVPTVGNTVGAGTCTGGSTWNGSFCGCPATQSWNGTSCVTFNIATAPGNCPLGQGWNAARTCVALPSGTSMTQVYSGGRNIPGTITVAVQNTVAQNVALCSAAGAFFDGRNCQTCPNRPGNAFAASDPRYVAPKTGVWNASALRCEPF